MSDHQSDFSSADSQGTTTVEHTVSNSKNVGHEERGDPVARISASFLDNGDSVIYAIVGICFLIGGLIALGYCFWDFAANLTSQKLTPPVFATAIIQFVSDLLLVLIIMEVLGTVTHYLQSHTTSLRPFLFIGIISATRGILSIGARLSIESNHAVTPEFTSAMIELGVNGAVILALGITLKLLGKLLDD
ncbi:MAG TPA: phosphate-starvation-inducible PsiE family protein [Ktedonobacteraceae bacterium]